MIESLLRIADMAVAPAVLSCHSEDGAWDEILVREYLHALESGSDVESFDPALRDEVAARAAREIHRALSFAHLVELAFRELHSSYLPWNRHQVMIQACASLLKIPPWSISSYHRDLVCSMVHLAMDVCASLKLDRPSSILHGISLELAGVSVPLSGDLPNRIFGASQSFSRLFMVYSENDWNPWQPVQYVFGTKLLEDWTSIMDRSAVLVDEFCSNIPSSMVSSNTMTYTVPGGRGFVVRYRSLATIIESKYFTSPSIHTKADSPAVMIRSFLGIQGDRLDLSKKPHADLLFLYTSTIAFYMHSVDAKLVPSFDAVDMAIGLALGNRDNVLFGLMLSFQNIDFEPILKDFLRNRNAFRSIGFSLSATRFLLCYLFMSLYDSPFDPGSNFETGGYLVHAAMCAGIDEEAFGSMRKLLRAMKRNIKRAQRFLANEYLKAGNQILSWFFENEYILTSGCRASLEEFARDRFGHDADFGRLLKSESLYVAALNNLEKFHPTRLTQFASLLSKIKFQTITDFNREVIGMNMPVMCSDHLTSALSMVLSPFNTHASRFLSTLRPPAEGACHE